MNIINDIIIWDGENSSINIEYGTLEFNEYSQNKFYSGKTTKWHSPIIRTTEDQWRMNITDYNYISLDVRLRSDEIVSPTISFYSWFYGFSNSLSFSNYYSNLEELYDGEWHTIYFPINDFLINDFIFDKIETIKISKENSTDVDFEIDIDNIKALLIQDSIEILFSSNLVTGYPPLTVSFINESNINDLNVVSWLWEFGDGTTSTSKHPTHVYESIGTYDVSLTLTYDTSSQLILSKSNYITILDEELLPKYARIHINFNELEYDIQDDMSYIKIPISVDNFGNVPIKTISITGERFGLTTINHFELLPGEKENTYFIYIKNNLIENIENLESAHVLNYVSRVISLSYQKFKSVMSLETLIGLITNIWNSGDSGTPPGDTSSPP